MKQIVLYIFILLTGLPLWAQDYYFVTFTDKKDSPLLDFSEEALAFRATHHIPTDSLDYVVSPLYLDSIQKAGATILHTSRWMNGATVQMDSTTIRQIESYSFIQEIEMTRQNTSLYSAISARKRMVSPIDKLRDLSSVEQLRTYNLLPLHELNYKGQGVSIAVIDAGFPGMDTSACFAHLYEEGRFKGLYDFSTEPEDALRWAVGQHGANCASFIVGQTDTYQGAAPQVNLFVMRTEENDTESPKELDNLIAAIEKCDSLGVWIISVSLGYSEFDNAEWDYTYSQLDGKSIRCSRAATIAARKGILVCCSAANYGNKPWRMIACPADADSILTIGAVGKDSIMGAFSSYGPSADGRVKPEVCAVGKDAVFYHTLNGAMSQGNGTSYAAPLMAGLAACLWSALPDKNNMEIRERIIRSSHQLLHPTDQGGYGIPNAWTAYKWTATYTNDLLDDTESASSFKSIEEGKIVIHRNGHKYTLLGHLIQ